MIESGTNLKTTSKTETADGCNYRFAAAFDLLQHFLTIHRDLGQILRTRLRLQHPAIKVERLTKQYDCLNTLTLPNISSKNKVLLARNQNSGFHVRVSIDTVQDIGYFMHGPLSQGINLRKISTKPIVHYTLI